MGQGRTVHFFIARKSEEAEEVKEIEELKELRSAAATSARKMGAANYFL
jgi:hypothetical protein